ncbi:hypothetical protein [Ascidiimonas aurantiaca]|uniref:hypothetical protein n=1 Tax=Ascidiimonas aurantiaca TaxID=1685432 RepID=UPI0030EDF491
MKKKTKVTLALKKKTISEFANAKLKGGNTAMLSSCGCGSAGCGPNTDSACKCL